MASRRHLLLLRSPVSHQTLFKTLRSLSTTTAPSHRNHHHEHEFMSPNTYLNSWKPPRDPKDAEAQLAQLRREYGKKVKEVRKEYIREMELQRIEKKQTDDARREALRIANEERKAAKTLAKKAKAAERQLAQEEFRQTLLKEREEKLEYWKMREKQIQEKKNEKSELLRRQSSMWVDESELEKKILEAIVDTSPL